MPPFFSKNSNSLQKTLLFLGLGLLLVGGLLALKWSLGPKFRFKEIKGRGIYRERGAKNFDAFIGSKKDKSKISFEVDGVGISYKLPFEKPEWQKNDKGELRSNTKGEKFFRYDFIEKKGKAVGLKTELVLKNKPSHNVFTFPMRLQGAKRKRNVGSRKFYDQNKNELFYIREPVMVDNNGEKSKDFDLRITRSQIALVPDKEWLNAEERGYPVVVDMSIKLANRSEP